MDLEPSTNQGPEAVLGCEAMKGNGLPSPPAQGCLHPLQCGQLSQGHLGGQWLLGFQLEEGPLWQPQPG